MNRADMIKTLEMAYAHLGPRTHQSQVQDKSIGICLIEQVAAALKAERPSFTSFKVPNPAPKSGKDWNWQMNLVNENIVVVNAWTIEPKDGAPRTSAPLGESA